MTNEDGGLSAFTSVEIVIQNLYNKKWAKSRPKAGIDTVSEWLRRWT